jgi:hypothetical protein
LTRPQLLDLRDNPRLEMIPQMCCHARGN